MTLADKLNALDCHAYATKGVVDVVPNDQNAYNEDDDSELRPQHKWLEDIESYLDRPSNDWPFSYYVEHGDECARWDTGEYQWVETNAN